MKLTLERRLYRPLLRPCCWARERYAEGNAREGVWIGELPRRRRLGLDALALLGWPLPSVRYHREQFRRWTAHPGDMWVDRERQLVGVVWKADARGTWLCVRSYEAALYGLARVPLLVPPHRYVCWTPARRGVLA